MIPGRDGPRDRQVGHSGAQSLASQTLTFDDHALRFEQTAETESCGILTIQATLNKEH